MVGHIMSLPPDVHILMVPGMAKKDSADVRKLRILRWEGMGLSWIIWVGLM